MKEEKEEALWTAMGRREYRRTIRIDGSRWGEAHTAAQWTGGRGGGIHSTQDGDWWDGQGDVSALVTTRRFSTRRSTPYQALRLFVARNESGVYCVIF